jgi:NADPH:quinone reductase
MAPIPAKMNVVQISKNGGLDVLENAQVPIPTPTGDEVLVKNAYCGVNFIDTYFRSGLYPAPRFPLVLGREASGEVVTAGNGFQEGDRVVYMSGLEAGSYAEYSAVSASKLIKIPDSVSLEKSAAVYLQGLTAWTFVREASAVKAGQWTFVHAAAGGVGQLLVQMLRSVGAKVIATASTDEKLEIAKKYGAGWTIKSSDDIVAKVKEITGGHGVDVIFDGNGNATFDADLEMIALKGQLISFGNAVSPRSCPDIFHVFHDDSCLIQQSGAVDPLNILRLGPKNVRLMRPIVNGYVSTREELEKYSNELLDLVASGKIEVNIHDVYPLADAKRAQADIESRKTSGKLLLKCT